MWELIQESVVKYWVAFVCGLLGGLLSYLWRRVSKMKKENKALHSGVLSLLRDRINQACTHHLKAESISLRDREVLNAMFESYFEMGGNGVVKHLKGEVDELPTRLEEGQGHA